MNQIERWRQETLRMLGQGIPLMYKLAADRILAQLKLADPQGLEAVLDVMDTWVRTFRALRQEVLDIEADALPEIAAAAAAIRRAGKPKRKAPGGLDNGASAKPGMRPRAPRRRVRPSHTPSPGELSEVAAKYWLTLEDDVRTLCFYGPYIEGDGPYPILPLVRIGKEELRGHGLRDLYKRGGVERSWAGRHPANIDRQLAEDQIILLAAYEPRLSHSERQARFTALAPYLRGVPNNRLAGHAWSAFGALVERGVIQIAEDGSWGLGTVETEAATRLGALWENPFPRQQ